MILNTSVYLQKDIETYNAKRNTYESAKAERSRLDRELQQLQARPVGQQNPTRQVEITKIQNRLLSTMVDLAPDLKELERRIKEQSGK